MPAHNSFLAHIPADVSQETQTSQLRTHPNYENLVDKTILSKQHLETNFNDEGTPNSSSRSMEHNKSPLGKLLISRSLASSTSSLNTLTLSQTNDSILSLDSSYISNDNLSTYQNTDLINDYYHKTQFTPQVTSILKPGSKFVGSQQSGRSTYEVEVELQYVDLSKSTLNGFLKIQGLTESHPEIITFFESEIISEKHSFFTDYQNEISPSSNDLRWGVSSREIDIQHWSKFHNWRTKLPTKKIISNNYIHKDFLKFENIYMRWKEKFLVPDHKVDSIEGASFAGFYYISFNQLTGNITGLYYHKSSEKFQQLELSYVDDRGVHSSFQFQ